MSIPLDTIYSYFKAGLFPTETQFHETWSSFWHKYEDIPVSAISGLDNQLQTKAEKDASNLDHNNVQSWKTALGVGELPKNVATIDDGNNVGNAYTKQQSDSRYMPTSILPKANYLLQWDGANFKESNLYYNAGRIGVGTTSPTEMIHLNNGRVKSKAYVLDENNETLVNQITSYNKKLLFTDNVGIKKAVLTNEDLPAEFMTLPSKLTETQKTIWKTEMNGGFTTASMSVSVINPAAIKKQNNISYISLRGSNLNFNPSNYQVDIVDMNGNVVQNVPSSQVQLYSNGLDLVFWTNLFSLPLGNYKVKLRNGLAEYTTSINFQIVEAVTNIDTTSILWNTKVYKDLTTSKMSALQSTVRYSLDSNVKSPADEAEYLFKAKTESPIFKAGQDFYMEFELPMFWVNGNISANSFGFSTSSDISSLNNDIIGGVDIGVRGDYVNWTNYTLNSGPLGYNQTINVVLVKRGNTLTRIVTSKNSNHTTTLVFVDNVAMVDGRDLYITAMFQNTIVATQAQKFMDFRIKELYTF